jgi:hypothetical protein
MYIYFVAISICGHNVKKSVPGGETIINRLVPLDRAHSADGGGNKGRRARPVSRSLFLLSLFAQHPVVKHTKKCHQQALFVQSIVLPLLV